MQMLTGTAGPFWQGLQESGHSCVHHLSCKLVAYLDGGNVPQVRNVPEPETFRFLIFAEPRLPNRCAVRQNPRFKNKYSSTFHILLCTYMNICMTIFLYLIGHFFPDFIFPILANVEIIKSGNIKVREQKGPEKRTAKVNSILHCTIAHCLAWFRLFNS